jgi:hypothetical protein
MQLLRRNAEVVFLVLMGSLLGLVQALEIKLKLYEINDLTLWETICTQFRPYRALAFWSSIRFDPSAISLLYILPSETIGETKEVK